MLEIHFVCPFRVQSFLTLSLSETSWYRGDYQSSLSLLLGTNLTLSNWSDRPDKDESKVTNNFILVYSLLGASNTLFFYCKELAIFLASAEASRYPLNYSLPQTYLNIFNCALCRIILFCNMLNFKHVC